MNQLTKPFCRLPKLNNNQRIGNHFITLAVEMKGDACSIALHHLALQQYGENRVISILRNEELSEEQNEAIKENLRRISKYYRLIL